MSEGDPFDTKINSLAGSSADNVMETTEDEESVKTNDDDSFNNSNQISDIPQLTGTSGTDLPLGVIMDVPDVSVKKFIFRSKSKVPGSSEYDTLSILVPERMQASYGLYVWPSAPVLAWYLYEHRHFLPGKRVLELGAGTALPGVLAAMCGSQVILSDSAKLPHCLEQCKITAETNGVLDKVQILGLTWGLFLNNLTKLRGQVDLILGSDCFYDPSVFEDLVSTVAYILENNPKAKFLSTYQERSSDWSIQHLLTKWQLNCKHVPLNPLANECHIDLLSMMQDHTIHLLEITLKDPTNQ